MTEVGEGESSAEKVMRDGGVVANIVSKLWSAQDKYTAGLVCKLWHEIVTWQASKLTLRTRDSLPHLVRSFKHIVSLDLSCCDEQLTNSDVEFCAIAFGHLKSLRVGQGDLAQDNISDEGLSVFAERCGYLEQLSLAGLPRVTDATIQTFSKGCRSLRSLILEHCRNLTDCSLEAICDFPLLEELQLKGHFKFTSAGLAKIGSNCRGLGSVCLELGSTNIDPALQSLAGGCPKLEVLSLSFKRANLRELGECRSLRSFAVKMDFAMDQGMSMDESALVIARANKSLREFSFLSVVAPLSDAAARGIILQCPLLEKLELEAVQLTDSSLMCIMNCKNLQHLVLDHLRSTGQGLGEIGMCGLGLRSLSLRYARRVRDVELQTLMDGNRGLEYLDLQSCQGPSAIGFSAIGICRNLQFLDVSTTHVDDVSLLTIASGVPNLKQLIMVKCKQVSSMATIAHFKSLESLIVDQCPFVRDEGLELVAVGCTRLIHLSLAFTTVTDKGLFHLTACSMLQSLRVSYCRLVQGEGVVAIAKACSGIHHIVLSHRFRNSITYQALKEKSCRVTLEMDDMALVPYDYNVLM